MDGDTRKVMQTELGKILRSIRPAFEPPTEVWEGYYLALDDVTAPEMMAMSREAVRKTWLYLPTPGDLRAIVLRIREEIPFEQPRACELCGGTRFRMVQLPGDGNYKAAVPCECMPEDHREAQKRWLKKFNPEYVSKAS